MKDWIHTRHCPTCEDVRLATGVIDNEGSIDTWCLNCNRVFRKYDPSGTLVWEDEEWTNNEEQ